jgi:hypothetical protein
MHGTLIGKPGKPVAHLHTRALDCGRCCLDLPVYRLGRPAQWVEHSFCMAGGSRCVSPLLAGTPPRDAGWNLRLCQWQHMHGVSQLCRIPAAVQNSRQTHWRHCRLGVPSCRCHRWGMHPHAHMHGGMPSHLILLCTGHVTTCYVQSATPHNRYITAQHSTWTTRQRLEHAAIRSQHC